MFLLSNAIWYISLIRPCLAAKHGEASVHLFLGLSMIGSILMPLSILSIIAGPRAYTWMERAPKERAPSFILLVIVSGVFGFRVYFWARSYIETCGYKL
jgi:hypothetical protein